MSVRDSSSPPASRKRSHDGTILPLPQTEAHDANGESSLPTPASGTPSLCVAERGRQSSPALSTASSSLTDLTDLTGEGSKTSLSAAPNKKRKLTFAEREVERAVRTQEKEARERQKAEDKARREMEKRARDEEKRKREEEKENSRRERELEKAEKQKAKDTEKRAKEEEKRKKDEEREKKERAQMKIGLFFSKPKIRSTTPLRNQEDVSSGVSSRRSSIVSLEDTEMREPPSTTTTMKIINPEYEKLFPPFFVHPNTELAPTTRLPSSKTDLDIATALSNPSIADRWSNTAPESLQRIQETFKFRSRTKRPSEKPVSVRSIIDRIQGSSNSPIDLTGDSPLLLDSLLDGVSLKVFSFHEDVRPSYHGTYTRPVSQRSRLCLRRHPSARKLPDTDYDYDSEAEWEPPDEGDDDVDAVDEESGSEDDEEDMEDFLDDEDDSCKRRLIVGNMDPVCSGLCWQGAADKRLEAAHHFNMKDLEMEVISEIHPFPIDPYSTKYWVQPKQNPPLPARSQLSPSSASLMQPPRLPLQASNQTNILLTPVPATREAQCQSTTPAENRTSPSKPLLSHEASRASRAPQKSLRLIPNELLPAFKQAVSGSDLNKVGLVEILKKQFPKVSKDVIRDTLSTVAVRQGAKEAEKRWVLVDPL